MTLPRPVLIALLGLALCAAAFLATRTANDTGDAVTSSPPTPVTKHAPKPADKPTAHKAAPARQKSVEKGRAAATPKPATKPDTVTKSQAPAK